MYQRRALDPPGKLATEFHGESYQHNDDVYLEVKSPLVILEMIPGVLPDEVYDSVLTWWRACIRGLLVRNLSIESRWLAVMQSRVRTDWLEHTSCTLQFWEVTPAS